MDNRSNTKSLSMKLRLAAVSVPSKKNNLMTFDGSSPSSSQGLRHSGYKSNPSTFKDQLIFPAFETKDQFERLSGHYDVINTTGVFPNRHHIMHPTSVCVRCSSHASVCMPCAEIMADDSLTFYRKTRAAGAAALFNRAVTEAGLQKLMKFALFRMIKNHTKKATILRQNHANQSPRQFLVYCTLPVFRAWRKFTKDNVIEKKNALIEKYTTKIENLEKEVQKVDAIKKHADSRIKGLERELQLEQKTTTEMKEEIGVLMEQVKRERKRVMGLSTLIQPVDLMSSSILGSTIKGKEDLSARLKSLQSDTLLFPNYERVFEKRVELDKTIERHRYQQQERANSVSSRYSKDLEKEKKDNYGVMLKWVNFVSDDCSFILEPHRRKSLDAYLPDGELVTDLKQMADGAQIARVIVTMIFYATFAITRDITTFLTTEELDALKAVKKKEAKDILCLVFTLGRKYLNTPPFRAQDVISGREDAIYNLLIYLNLIAVPSRHMEDTALLKDKEGKIEELENEIIAAEYERNGLNLLSSMQKVLTSIRGVTTTSAPAEREVEPEAKIEESAESFAEKGGGLQLIVS